MQVSNVSLSAQSPLSGPPHSMTQLLQVASLLYSGASPRKLWNAREGKERLGSGTKPAWEGNLTPLGRQAESSGWHGLSNQDSFQVSGQQIEHWVLHNKVARVPPFRVA